MNLEMYRDPVTRDLRIRAVITDKDQVDFYSNATLHEKFELDHFAHKTSIEETLMGLQVYARVLERVEKKRAAEHALRMG